MRSYSEIVDLVGDYWNGASSLEKILFNLFYNSGTIIKGITNIAMFSLAIDYTRVKTPFSMGMELGQVFWLIFYPSQTYLDKVLDKGGIWGQDYTWDAVIAIQLPDDEEQEGQVVIGTPSEDQLAEEAD